MLGGIEAVPVVKTIKVNNDSIPFEITDGILGIRTEGGMFGGIDAETNEIVLSSVTITGYNKTNEKTQINTDLEFTDDFEYEGNKLSIRWHDII